MSGVGLQPSSPSPPRERIADAVLGASRRTRRGRWLLPAGLALAAHVTLALLSPGDASNERWALATAQRVRSLLSAEAARSVDLPPAPAPEEKKPPRLEPEPARPKLLPAAARSPTRQRIQAPAQAGNIIARASATDAPVDLSFAFVVGTGKVYAGGSATSSGTSSKAVNGPVSTEPAPAPEPAAPDRSRPIALADPDWTCPWPPEADDAQLDEQAAVIHVVVTPEGRCESPSIVQDPGHGFGSSAAKCARDAEFLPALDRSGHPVRAESNIRVRFTR